MVCEMTRKGVSKKENKQEEKKVKKEPGERA